MAVQYRFVVEGLNPLVRGLRRAGDELGKDLQKELRLLAKHVATQAQKVAEAKGLHDSGQLVAKIKPSVRGGTAWVRDAAQRRGYNYPGRYEYGDRHRPFLEPALASEQDVIFRGLEAMLDRLLARTDLT